MYFSDNHVLDPSVQGPCTVHFMTAVSCQRGRPYSRNALISRLRTLPSSFISARTVRFNVGRDVCRNIWDIREHGEARIRPVLILCT